MSLTHEKHVNDTELSKYLWKLKEENPNYNIQWSIRASTSLYKCETRKCDLCLIEKMIIARSDPKKLLKKAVARVPVPATTILKFEVPEVFKIRFSKVYK